MGIPAFTAIAVLTSKHREWLNGEPSAENRTKYQYNQVQSKLSGYATNTGRREPATFFTHRPASVITFFGSAPS